MARKQKRPSWFKMVLSQKALIDSVSDEVAGKALKTAFAYFDEGFAGGEAPSDLDPLVFAVFASIKPYIDESFEDYRKSVEWGKDGADRRHGPSQAP